MLLSQRFHGRAGVGCVRVGRQQINRQRAVEPQPAALGTERHCLLPCCSAELLVLVYPSKDFMCEMRKRIVARSHDHNSIATAGQPNQSVAAAAAVWKRKGIAT